MYKEANIFNKLPFCYLNPDFFMDFTRELVWILFIYTLTFVYFFMKWFKLQYTYVLNHYKDKHVLNHYRTDVH